MTEAGLAELDAHHVIPRDLMPNGGYVPQNGVTVCGSCHEGCESYWVRGDGVPPRYWPEQLFRLIGSSFEQAVEASEKF